MVLLDPDNAFFSSISGQEERHHGMRRMEHHVRIEEQEAATVGNAWMCNK
jgi:hypothetical protein